MISNRRSPNRLTRIFKLAWTEGLRVIGGWQQTDIPARKGRCARSPCQHGPYTLTSIGWKRPSLLGLYTLESLRLTF
ncbi:hypothetical protein [Ktedonobacter robiniae]|uniref:hypothetical protein n=1 Tax=Ktedonobacter robiniae TaxID=2778365 RepID=UPI001914E0FB|nr:hypothetical protein [Ktedonobacter robiniae]